MEEMSGYYPAGVSGFEDEISGPRREYDAPMDAECDDCGWVGTITATVRVWRDERDASWRCPSCSADQTETY